MKRDISIIVPAKNEMGNIVPLVARINSALSGLVDYEVIFVDDYSSDTTKEEIKSIAQVHTRIRYVANDGKKGKAFALLKGFSQARAPILAMIDADLQYPPEAIYPMYKMVMNGVGVVVANREQRDESWKRRVMSETFRDIFGKRLHKMDVDVQSGLKVFRTSLLEHVSFTPKPWTFDLNFLLTSRMAGYDIDSYDIEFKNRVTGKSKVKTLQTIWEIGKGAIESKINPPEVSYLHQSIDSLHTGFYHNDTHYVPFTRLSHHESAFITLSMMQKMTLLLGLITLGLFLVLNPFTAILGFLAFMTAIYFLDILVNAGLIGYSLCFKPELKVSDTELDRLRDDELPTYTIFCPLYKEWQVLPQFVEAMKNLDYPKYKLEIMLLMESNDERTQQVAEELDLPDYFKVTVVPKTLPKTKPKACNFGLLQATGEYSVIFDAEDIPDPKQLKKVVVAFGREKKNLACIQAKLNFYNPEQNILTRLFTSEYSLWFELVLTGLHAAKAPIPLGGTSNHFKTNVLRDMEGWDSFNVTEDADLGIRLSKGGYATSVLDSVTLEEANSDFYNWINQRTRWIKGYMQTLLVHMRDWRQFLEQGKHFEFLSFLLIIGGKLTSLLVNPLMWILTILYFSLRAQLGPVIESLFPPQIFYLGVFSMVVGNFLYLYYYFLGLAKRKQYHLIKYAYLTPLYWLLMSMAAWVALGRLIVQPHHWFKTKHGLHLSPISQNVATVPLRAKHVTH